MIEVCSKGLIRTVGEILIMKKDTSLNGHKSMEKILFAKKGSFWG